jgi:hypothetical protein
MRGAGESPGASDFSVDESFGSSDEELFIRDGIDDVYQTTCIDSEKLALEQLQVTTDTAHYIDECSSDDSAVSSSAPGKEPTPSRPAGVLHCLCSRDGSIASFAKGSCVAHKASRAYNQQFNRL